MTRKVTVAMAMTKGMAKQTGLNEELHFSIKYVQTRFGNRKCFRTIMSDLQQPVQSVTINSSNRVHIDV
jgi:hypothetical protein